MSSNSPLFQPAIQSESDFTRNIGLIHVGGEVFLARCFWGLIDDCQLFSKGSRFEKLADNFSDTKR